MKLWAMRKNSSMPTFRIISKTGTTFWNERWNDLNPEMMKWFGGQG
jgi:hypothetical protein